MQQWAEGLGLERLVGVLYEERSRKGLAGFPLTTRIEGYWDRGDSEIDLVALDEAGRRIRFGSVKRSANELPGDVPGFEGHVGRFLKAHARFRDWTVERVAIAPSIPGQIRVLLQRESVTPQDLRDLTGDL